MTIFTFQEDSRGVLTGESFIFCPCGRERVYGLWAVNPDRLRLARLDTLGFRIVFEDCSFCSGLRVAFDGIKGGNVFVTRGGV